MLEHIFFDILEMTVAASIIILMIDLCLPKLDRKYGLGWRKAFWILLGIRLLIPYNFSWDKYALHIFPVTDNWQLPGLLVPAAAGISILWFVGLFLYLRHNYLCYKHFLRQVTENSTLVEAGEEKEMLADVAGELGIKREIALYRSSIVQSPMVMQMLEPMLILPDTEYTRQNLLLIFRHECMHIDNLDLVYKAVMLLAGAVHWFNPLVHRMVKLSYRDVEIFCDQCVTEDMDKSERGAYGKAILEAAGKQKNTDIALSTCFYGDERIMKQRVEHLFFMDQKKNGALIFTGMLFLMLFLGIFIKCGI